MRRGAACAVSKAKIGLRRAEDPVEQQHFLCKLCARFFAHDAIHGKAVAALIAAHRRLGLRTEDAVRHIVEVAKVNEVALQLLHFRTAAATPEKR